MASLPQSPPQRSTPRGPGHCGFPESSGGTGHTGAQSPEMSPFHGGASPDDAGRWPVWQAPSPGLPGTGEQPHDVRSLKCWDSLRVDLTFSQKRVPLAT